MSAKVEAGFPSDIAKNQRIRRARQQAKAPFCGRNHGEPIVKTFPPLSSE
jgi:hypothetical protein